MPTERRDVGKRLIEIIVAENSPVRDISLDQVCNGLERAELMAACESLESFRLNAGNLYQRVRALFLLYAIHRFHLPVQLVGRECGEIPVVGYENLLSRRFSEAIRDFLAVQKLQGPSITLSSALATAYHRLAFQTLADQVRSSVRYVKGNQWMFRTGHPADLPLRLRPELLRTDAQGMYPVLKERTSVRMDFSHSGWSDIFFLGMDYPEGARVINASIDLAVRGQHSRPQPPIECAVRVIDEPVLRLVSVDLSVSTDVTSVPEVFDFARDYLGLVKAAVIAAGLVPPGMEGCDASIEDVLTKLVGPDLGLEVVSRVNDIPKGSRLAVSTNLLGSLIAVCMRATGQVSSFTGTLTEDDRRIVAARAILGEWIGGSGGGWQDSGGIWPGIKLISGAVATEGDPEFGVSRGRLLPTHHVFEADEISHRTREQLQNSLVLVHGGMAQNVGPILEMVTEKYLLRCEDEWQARREAMSILEEIQDALRSGDLQAVGKLTQRNFSGPLQRIIPWCSNHYTETLINKCRSQYQDRFWGFWMLGGMAGGGMGFIFDPACKAEASNWLGQEMLRTKREMESCLPFAMDPVVYDFEINALGTAAEFSTTAAMPDGYYELMLPGLLKLSSQELSTCRRRELEQVGQACRDARNSPQQNAFAELSHRLMDRILPRGAQQSSDSRALEVLLRAHGFDPVAHEQLREELRGGRLGLSQNRLPATTSVADVLPEDIVDARGSQSRSLAAAGENAIRAGEVAVLTLAAGVGSRWTQGAGVVKALHPFCKMSGKHRTFLQLHLAKSRMTGESYGRFPTHIVATGYMTEGPISQYIESAAYPGKALVSNGRNVGLRMIPTRRDLLFAWEEMQQQTLDEQQEKMRLSARAALLKWAQSQGEASDYVDNLPMQCMHPVGHWFEIPNLMLNGVLAQLLQDQPELKHLMLHNVDTLGASLDPEVLAIHLTSGACLSFEVISRRLEDRGGGLARIDGRPRLVEGLAMPNEQDEFKLSYYNSMTTWIDIDRLLNVFGLTRDLLQQGQLVQEAVRRIGRRLPTYITLKEVKKRWGNGQEDVFPVSQFEKLWGDMSALSEVDCQFIVVPTVRGQQLKEQSQLDGWLRDGSARQIDQLCSWSEP